MDTKKRLTAVRREGIGSWVKRVKGLSKEKKEKLMDTDHVMVTAKGDGVWAGVDKSKGRINGDRRLDLGL